MNDHIAGENLAAYVDGALKGEAKAGVEAHLSRCPECLESLADIIDIRDSRVKIPGEFLRCALKVPVEGALKVPAEGRGEKEEPARLVLPMRLVFGVAAVLLVVVMIGYFFLGGGRSERRAGARKDRSDLVAKKTVPEKAAAGKPVPVPVSQAEPAKAQAEAKARRKQFEKGAAPSPTLEAIEKKSEPAPAPADALTGLADEEAEPMREQEPLIGGLQAQAEKDKSTAGDMTVARASAPQALPEAHAMKKEAKSRFRSPGAGEMAASAVQMMLAATGRAAAPLGFRLQDLSPGSRIHLAGEVSLADLRNPGLLDEWSWFPEGRAMELEIASGGSVSAVSLVGQWDQRAAAAAQAEARKLLFSISGRKLRRAVMTVSETPPN